MSSFDDSCFMSCLRAWSKSDTSASYLTQTKTKRYRWLENWSIPTQHCLRKWKKPFTKWCSDWPAQTLPAVRNAWKVKWLKSENCQKMIWIHRSHYICLDIYCLRFKSCWKSTIGEVRTISALDAYANMIQESDHYFQATMGARKSQIRHFIKLTTLKSVPSLKTIGSIPSILPLIFYSDIQLRETQSFL